MKKSLIKEKIKKILSFYFRFGKKEIKIVKEGQNEKLDKGFLYIVFGNSFTKEAVLSIKSLKRYNNEPVAIFTDNEKLLEEIKNEIDFIYKINPKHIRAKVDFIGKSPFKKTIYLDSDTIIVSNISDIFELLNKFDVAYTLDFARKRKNMSEKIKKYSEIPYSFSEINGGVLAFRKDNNVDEFLNKWKDYFYKFFVETNGWDQPSLRIALWESNLKLVCLPFEYNIRPKKLIEKIKNSREILGDEHMKPRIYHMHYSEKIHENEFEIKTIEEAREIIEKIKIEVSY